MKIFGYEIKKELKIKPSCNMEGLRYVENIRKYLDYLEEHLSNIDKAFYVLSRACNNGHFSIMNKECYFKLKKDIEEHDLSKFSMGEFIPYVNLFYPVNEVIMSDAIKLHVENNNHHYEWIKLNRENISTIQLEMSLFLMLVDWLAMSYKFGDTVEEFYNSKKDIYIFTEYEEKFILKILKALRGYNE